MARTTYASPLGTLTLVAGDEGLEAVRLPGEDAPVGNEQPDHPVLLEAARQLDEYFAGSRREFDLPLAPHGTAFQLQVWEVLRQIPYATTISYGEQAGRLGDRRKARAAGAANGRNPLPIVVPCHRVIGADGTLTGFTSGIETKAWLLDHERAVAGSGSR